MDTLGRILHLLETVYKDHDNFFLDSRKGKQFIYHSKTLVSIEVLMKMAEVAKVIGVQSNNNRRLFNQGFEVSVFLEEKHLIEENLTNG